MWAITLRYNAGTDKWDPYKHVLLLANINTLQYPDPTNTDLPPAWTTGTGVPKMVLDNYSYGDILYEGKPTKYVATQGNTNHLRVMQSSLTGRQTYDWAHSEKGCSSR